MKRKKPKAPRNTGKQLAALPLIDWIQYGDLIAEHGKADGTLRAVHDWQQSTGSRAKPEKDGQHFVALTEGELRFLAETFGKALMELNPDVFDQFAKAVRRFRSKGHFTDPNSQRLQPGKLRRYSIARVAKFQTGPAWTLEEWADRLSFERDPYSNQFDEMEVRNLRRVLTTMGMAIGKGKIGRPRVRKSDR